MSGGVENVLVEDSHMKNAGQALRIKRRGTRGYVKTFCTATSKSTTQFIMPSKLMTITEVGIKHAAIAMRPQCPFCKVYISKM